MRFILSLVSVVMATSMTAVSAEPQIPLDDGWKFVREDVSGAEAASFDDGRWKSVDLPHDWSIAGPIARENPMGSPGGFFPSGVGWYRKTFDAPGEWSGKRVTIQFDGVYMVTDVWINGVKVGSHLYGFTPFAFDLTPHLKTSATNTLAVRVDNSKQQNCRWYSGSGIYRHVRLDVREPIHIAQFGTFIRTIDVSNGAAKLALSVTIESQSNETRVQCDTQIFHAGADGKPAGDALARFATVNGKVTRESGATMEAEATLSNPRLWTPETPDRYVAVTTISANGKTHDTRQTTFGVRTIEVSAAKGFMLNGKPVEMYGACVHDDNGALGVAAFDRAEERRVEMLKAAGFNAVRCAHNPPAPAFLEACDRLGLLVINEIFDTWSLTKTPEDFGKDFRRLWQNELDAMILRDRNHPSIIMWSLGNEIGNLDKESGMIDGTKLIDRARQLDPTRFTNTAVPGWNLPDKLWELMHPLLNKFDVVGYNYAIHRYEQDHKQFPERVIVGTESFPRELFETYDQSEKHPHILGDFVWTGIDYLGESGIGRYHHPDEHIYFHLDPRHFPYHGAYCGDIDITGFRKPISYARNITWNRGETLYTSVMESMPDGRLMRVGEWGIVPSRASWTWPGKEGMTLQVMIYSRHDSVRLYLNDQLVGEKPTTRKERFKAMFEVPYAAGALKTIGVRDGKEVETHTLKTAGPVAGLRLISDRKEFSSNGQDLVFVDVESIDANGNFQPTGDQQITFNVDGAATIAGVGSADYGTRQGYHGNQRRLFNGRAQLILRSTHQPGEVTVHASADGLKETSVRITSR